MSNVFVPGMPVQGSGTGVGVSGFAGQPQTPGWATTAGTLLGGAIVGAARGYFGSTATTAGETFPTGSRIDITESTPKRRRRRRRRLLTCQDKADIAFLHGQLGGGQLGRAAISSLLSRRCG